MNYTQPQADILQGALEAWERQENFAMAVVLKTLGSTPCIAGSKAIFHEGGGISGTVGGGLVEAEAKRRAREVVSTRHAQVFDFALEGDSLSDGRPICGGTMRLLILPKDSGLPAAYARALELRKRRERGVLLTTISNAGERAAVQCLDVAK